MAIRSASTFDDDRLFEGDADDGGAGESISSQFDIQHYLRTLRKRKWPITLFTAAVVGLASYYAFSATPVYSSTSTLLIESQSDNLIQFDELVGLDSESQDYYETQYELLRSRGLALRVVNHLDLWNNPELSPRNAALVESNKPQSSALEGLNGLLARIGITPTQPDAGAEGAVTIDLNNVGDTSSATGATLIQQDPNAIPTDLDNAITGDNANGPLMVVDSDAFLSTSDTDTLSGDRCGVVDTFMSRLSVTPVRKTKLVRVSFESVDPQLAARVANAVGDQYIESYLDAKLELTTKASQWLNERLTELRIVLDESEEKLIRFKQENGLVDVGGSVGRLNEQELLLATAELAQARSDFATQSDIYREVQNLRGSPELLESIPAIQSDPLVQRVKIEQGQAQRALDELRNRYGDRHPRVVDATSQLATLNTTLQGHINRVVGTISNDYQLLRQRVATIEAKLADGKQEIQALGTKKFELDELERKVATNREVYSTFFSRITEARSADGLDNANARISDPAIPALSPIKPKKQLIIALAALASLLLSMLMAVLYEEMDDTIKSTGDVENKLGVKLIGILPLIKGGMFGRSRSLPLNPEDIVDKKGTFTEAVNTARTALCMGGESANDRKIFVVTSSVPGEGKSTTSINLAYSFGQLERVLIIDCDMRRPTIAKAAGLDKDTVGLSNLITKTAPAKDCIKRHMFGGFVDIIPSGPLPDHPLELLSSKRFEKILEQLTEHYDRIVIDSAPTQAVSDALVLSSLSDSVIYCVKSHETSIELVRRGLQRLRQVDAPLAGVIITQVDVAKIQSYGGDHYYQGYYDYYGYSEPGEKADMRRGRRLSLSQAELHDIRNDDRDVDLGLDFGSERGRNASVADDFDELDMTAELNVSGRKMSRLGPRRLSQNDRRNKAEFG